MRAAHSGDGIRRTAAQCAARGVPVDVLEGSATEAATGTDRYSDKEKSYCEFNAG